MIFALTWWSVQAVLILADMAIVLLFSALGVLEFRRLTRVVGRGRQQIEIGNVHKLLPYVIPVSLSALGVIIALIISGLYSPIAWRIPEWLELARPWVTWGILLGVMAFVFTMGVAALFFSGHRTRWTLLVAGWSLAAAFVYLHWSLYSSIAPQLGERTDSNGVVLQTSGVSCAAATSANVARHFGVFKSEREMAELLGTNKLGTSPAQIIRGMRQLGITCRKVQIIARDPAKLQMPAMLFVDHPATGAESHIIALAAVTGSNCEIYDPLIGGISLPLDRIQAMWRGRALLCRRSSDGAATR